MKLRRKTASKTNKKHSFLKPIFEEWKYWLFFEYLLQRAIVNQFYNQQIRLPLLHILNHNMCQRKIWKIEEDQILKELYEQKGIKKWSQISRLMQVNYGIQGRNGKQCRQRYHNHLKGGINKDKWSKDEQLQLIRLHAEHGNRWALISKLIVGRTQNCVKNMLYSKLRKSIRQLNRFGYQHNRKELKEIKINFIYRLVEFTQHTYQKQSLQRSQQQTTAIRLKNDLLNMENMEEQNWNQTQKQLMIQLIEDIHSFKRVNQRYRGHLHKSNKKKNSYKKQNNFIESTDNLDQDVNKSEREEKMVEDSSIKTKEQGIEEPGHSIIIETKSKTGKKQSCSKQRIQALLIENSQNMLPTVKYDYGLEMPLQTETPLQIETPHLNYISTPVQSSNHLQDCNNYTNWHSFFTFFD